MSFLYLHNCSMHCIARRRRGEPSKDWPKRTDRLCVRCTAGRRAAMRQYKKIPLTCACPVLSCAGLSLAVRVCPVPSVSRTTTNERQKQFNSTLVKCTTVANVLLYHMYPVAVPTDKTTKTNKQARNGISPALVRPSKHVRTGTPHQGRAGQNADSQTKHTNKQTERQPDKQAAPLGPPAQPGTSSSSSSALGTRSVTITARLFLIIIL